MIAHNGFVLRAFLSTPRFISFSFLIQILPSYFALSSCWRTVQASCKLERQSRLWIFAPWSVLWRLAPVAMYINQCFAIRLEVDILTLLPDGLQTRATHRRWYKLWTVCRVLSQQRRCSRGNLRAWGQLWASIISITSKRIRGNASPSIISRHPHFPEQSRSVNNPSWLWTWRWCVVYSLWRWNRTLDFH